MVQPEELRLRDGSPVPFNGALFTQQLQVQLSTSLPLTSLFAPSTATPLILTILLAAPWC